jgi:agmatine deiminase
MVNALTLLSPAALTFSMPAEWSPHEATWMAWPHNEELWVGGHLEATRGEFAQFINTLAKYERVELLIANTECEEDAKRRLRGNVRFHKIDYSDVWLRDSGPIFVKNPAGENLITDWEFNGWGNKFDSAPDNKIPCAVASVLGASFVSPGIVMEGGSLEVNEKGVMLSTKQCLLSKERNPTLSEGEIEQALRSYLGATKIIWLGDGLENDHTDGHIDTITRFANSKTIVTCVCEDMRDPNYLTMQANLEVLMSATDGDGNPFSIVQLPLPVNRLELEGERLAPTYANFYICNGAVIVPQYDDPNDARALEILTPLFPGRDLIGLPGRALITGGGSFHCVTQQQPIGPMWRQV